MDAALNQLQDECSTTEYQNAVKLLFVYIKNIYQNKCVEKYRKIRIGNEKFHSNVWRHEACRTLLLLGGFEQMDEFILLPGNVDVTVFYDFLQRQFEKVNHTSQPHTPASPIQQTATLKLNAGNQSGGIFVADLQADLTLLSYMVEMGYSKHASEKGLLATKNQGVQPAMDWIASHPECHYVEEKPSAPTLDNTAVASPSTSQDAKSNITSRLRNANEQKYAYQEKLRQEAIKKAKLEKAEDQIAKKHLYKNIQSERQVSKEKFEREKVIRHAESEQQEKVVGVGACPPTNINTCAVRIRMHNGQTLMWETDETTRVKDLYSHVISLMSGSDEEFHVCVPHPHEVLDKGDESLLQDKGLYPKATVVVQKVAQPTTVEGSDVLNSGEVTQPTSVEGSDIIMNPGEIIQPTRVEGSDIVMNPGEEGTPT